MANIEEKNFFTRYATSWFIIIGLIGIIISLAIPESIHAFGEKHSCITCINFFSAVGSILIVGGIFEVLLKYQFIKEVSRDFIKTLFLERSSLSHFNDNDLLQMKKNIQGELVGEQNIRFKTKFLRMINDSFFQIAQGKHINPEFNMYYEYYNVVIYVKESSSTHICIEYDLKCKLKNNRVDNKHELKESSNSVFAKRFFPPFSKDETTQGLIALTIKVDGDRTDYDNEIGKGLFEEQIVNKSVEDDVKALHEDTKKQIQKKGTDGSFTPFEVKFTDELIIEKKIWVKTLYTDLSYNHIFKRPTLNYSIQFIDENVDTALTEIDYLSLRLFSGLNKKNNDKIHPVLKGHAISLTVSDELLLAGEGISILAIRKDWIKEREEDDGICTY